MKLRYFPLFCLFVVFACEGSVSTAKGQTLHKGLSYDTAAIYRSITTEICNCLSREKENHKTSVAVDTCFKIVTAKFADTLKAIGVDISVSPVENNLAVNVKWIRCGNIFHLMEEEHMAEEAKLLLVKGEFISQRKLATGEYEVILHENKTGKQKVLKSKNRFPEEIVKDEEPGYELTVEYKVVKNKTTGENELYIKDVLEGGRLDVIGAVKFQSQK